MNEKDNFVDAESQVTSYTTELNTTFPIYIYGTGTVAKKVCSILLSKSIQIIAYLDHRQIDRSIMNDNPILDPNSEKVIDKNNSTVILAIHNREVDIPALIHRLKKFGYSRFITMVDFYNMYSNDLGSMYWLTPRSIYSFHKAAISEASALFVDQSSRELFNNIVQFRINGDYSLLPQPDTLNQYFPTELLPWQTPMRLMDCGAYDGDTIRALLARRIPLEGLAAYEPDNGNFLKLVDTVQKNHLHNVLLWPCGVFSTTTQMRFKSGQGEASLISDTGEAFIQCVSIDESAADFAPTLIKMDVEGAEKAALLGAEKTIARYQPGLAISVYHLAEHLWDIPLIVNDFAKKYNLHYNYYLKSHAYNSFETIFYALPVKGSK